MGVEGQNHWHGEGWARGNDRSFSSIPSAREADGVGIRGGVEGAEWRGRWAGFQGIPVSVLPMASLSFFHRGNFEAKWNGGEV